MRLLTTPITTRSCNESNDANDVGICILVFMRKVENTPQIWRLSLVSGQVKSKDDWSDRLLILHLLHASDTHLV